MKEENNFVQWKGTDICMDFHCECGHHNHYDGFFAYYVKCAGCEQVYKMDESIKMQRVYDENLDPIESIQFP